MDAVRQSLPDSPLALSWRFAQQLTEYEAKPAPVAKMDLRLRLRCAQLRVRRLFDSIECDIRLSPTQVACMASWTRMLYRAAVCVGNDGRRCAHVSFERAVAALSRGVHRTTGLRRLGRLVKWNVARDAYLTVGDAFEHVVQIPLLDEKWVLANRDVLQARNRKKEGRRPPRRRTAASREKCARAHNDPQQDASVGGSYGEFRCPPPISTRHGDTVAGRASQLRSARGRFLKTGSERPREGDLPRRGSGDDGSSGCSRSAPGRSPQCAAESTGCPAPAASGSATLTGSPPLVLKTGPLAAALCGEFGPCPPTTPADPPSGSAGQPFAVAMPRSGIVPCRDVTEARAYLARLAAQEAAQSPPEGLAPSHSRAAQQSAPRGELAEAPPLSHAPSRQADTPEQRVPFSGQ